MAEKRCPKCGKAFEESWKLCDDCGVDLVIPQAEGGTKAYPLFIAKIKGTFRNLDSALDSKMSKAVDTADEAKESLEALTKQAAAKATEISEKAEKQAQILERKGLDFTKRMRRASSPNEIMDTVLDNPKTVLAVVVIISVIIGGLGVPSMMNNISGDMTIYLPQDDESAIILNEVEIDFSTNIGVLFVETPNKDNPTYSTNITDKAVLDEISAIENALDPLRDDYGAEDGISFILSISTLIKEINEAPKNVWYAVAKEIDPDLDPGPPPGEYEYEIPEDQDEIDRIVAQIPDDTKKMLVIDTGNDGIWDSAGIIFGVESKDQAKLMEEIYIIINEHYVDSRVESSDYNSEEKWWERVEIGEVHCRMTPTGPVPITEALTARTYQEFMIVLPAALILIAAMLFFFHRTPKIIIVTGIPIFCSLVITLGIMGLTGWVLSPQVILVAPILLALGVAYGLYIANRYSEERHNIKDKRERMQVAIQTTGKAIFLSAVTTAVGFSSLMFVNMVPLRVLGFGLTVGIMICYAVTMLIVPSLVMLLDYEKKAKIRSTERLGMVPIRHRKKIVIFAVIITIISLALVPSIQANMDLTEMAPHDEPTVKKMIQYTEAFGGGQMGMVLVRGPAAPGPNDPNQHTNGKGSMKDIEVLDKIEQMELQLKRLTNEEGDPLINPPISVVDVMKMIKVPESFVARIPMDLLPQVVQDRVLTFVNRSFWDAIHLASDDENSIWNLIFGKTQQEWIISVFYNSISTEMRGFLVNSDYSKALVYIDMPAMDAISTEYAVNEVNTVVTNYPAGSSTSKLTGFAALVVAVNNLLMFNAIFSLFMALIIVFFVLIVIFRSLRLAALTMIPVSMVVAWEPLALGVTGIDLNLVTAMIGSIIVGIGIDFGIHMTERIRESGEDFSGIKKSVETSGFSFLEATATIVAGMLSIFLINIQSIQEFIMMIIILLVFSMVGAMFILPAIYAMLTSEKTKDAEFIGEVTEVEPEYGYE